MELVKLITTACEQNKISEMEVIKMLTDELDCDTGYLCETIYKKAYGENLSKELAEEIVKSMSVTDDSSRENGQKWNMDQTSSIGAEVGVDWNKIAKINFYVVMNMMYSDFRRTAEKVEYEDDPKFYAYLAKDWLCDDDAPSDKLFRYIFKVLM